MNLNEVIAKLDLLTSFALTAANAVTPYIRPQMRPIEDGILKLKSARHPMLEAQNAVSVIPNDISLDKNGTTFYIITGNGIKIGRIILQLTNSITRTFNSFLRS